MFSLHLRSEPAPAEVARTAAAAWSGNAAQASRYVLQYRPRAQTALAQIAAAWLVGASPTAVPPLNPAERARLTAALSGNGFCSNLTPPFELAARFDEADLTDAVAALARTAQGFDLSLQLDEHDRALVIAGPVAQTPLQALRTAGLGLRDRLAAPAPGRPARGHRGHRGPQARHGEDLLRLPLTARIPNNTLRARIREALERVFAEALVPPHRFDTISLAVQTAGVGPFREGARFDLGGCAP